MNKEYFAYIRVSTVKQGEGASLGAQREAIERYAAHNGLVVSEWLEEKETASKQGRPIFSDMIKRLYAGKAHGVIMHKIDRSARNFRDWATVGELHDSGVEVRFANETVDFTSRGGRLSADIQAVFAADYIRNLREERTKGVNGRLKEGLYPFKAPIGYLDNGGGQVKTIDPARGLLVKQVFELYNTGQYSFDSLAHEMSKRGLRGKLGKRVYKGKIERILSNPFYVGVMEVLTTGETHQGIHEPLISAELFQSVQERRLGRTNKKMTKHNFLYRGLFKCADCSNSMIPERQRGHVYYRCHTANCQTTTVRENVLESSVVEQLSKLEIAPNLVADFCKKLEAGLRQLPDIPRRDTTAIARAKLDTQNDNLVNAMLNGTVDEETYKSKRRELKLAEAALKGKQKSWEQTRQKHRYLTRFLEHAKNLAGTYVSALAHEKRQFMEMAFSNIQVSGREPLFKPRNWIVEAVDIANGPYGGLYEAINRSRQEIPEQVIASRIDAIVDTELCNLVDLCDAIQDRASRHDLPEQVNQESSSAT